MQGILIGENQRGAGEEKARPGASQLEGLGCGLRDPRRSFSETHLRASRLSTVRSTVKVSVKKTKYSFLGTSFLQWERASPGGHCFHSSLKGGCAPPTCRTRRPGSRGSVWPGVLLGRGLRVRLKHGPRGLVSLSPVCDSPVSLALLTHCRCWHSVPGSLLYALLPFLWTAAFQRSMPTPGLLASWPPPSRGTGLSSSSRRPPAHRASQPWLHH